VKKKGWRKKRKDGKKNKNSTGERKNRKRLVKLPNKKINK
jgi:hypothetical protein